ncbi:MAG: MaoC family dehydratase N-terminal domain-containing protein [Dehalococcoidia bacterium]|nr:MaoC family dehydratase N-terminal domain-containing protein [Dehalococcoidia bacterium]
MADAVPLITDEMRATIGKESDPTTSEVDRTAIRMFARSVGHTDPIYYDEAAAKAAGYRDVVAPPGYLGTPVFNPNAPSRRGGGGMFGGPEPGRPLKRILNGGTEIEYLEDICAGDVLTSTSHVANYEETKGSIGDMLITTSKTVYKNQLGKVVAIMTGTGIRY